MHDGFPYPDPGQPGNFAYEGPKSAPAPHPAALRWQLACVRFDPAIERPAASDLVGRDCKLIWVDSEDWQRFMDWQRATLAPQNR